MRQSWLLNRLLASLMLSDTAGRPGVDAEMMAQAAAIRDAPQPDEVLFVVDAMIGQDAVTSGGDAKRRKKK